MTPSKEHQEWFQDRQFFERYPLKNFDLGTQTPRNSTYPWWNKKQGIALEGKSLQKLSTQRRLTLLISAYTELDTERCAIMMSLYIPWLLLRMKTQKEILPCGWNT